MRARGAAASRGGAVDHEQRARPEQHRKHAAHLRIDEDEVEEPGRNIGAAGRPAGGGVRIGRKGQGEGDDIHRQYAHHRNAANGVEAFVTRCRPLCFHAPFPFGRGPTGIARGEERRAVY